MKQRAPRGKSTLPTNIPGQRAGNSPRSGQHSPSWKDPRWWCGIVCLVALVATVYWPTLSNGFIWDDETYVENNVTLQSLQGLYEIWFKVGAVPQYYPLVHTTFWVEHQCWGLDARGYHVVNMLLHAASAVVLWRLLVGLRLPGAWLAAAIFAVHPVHVETVAWVTERKNLLSCLFGLCAIWSYLLFSPPEPLEELRTPADRKSGRWWFYGLAFLLYTLALLSKTVACSVPAVLLVIYWWKRGRFDVREALRLTPFFAIGLALASLTVWMEKHRVLAIGEAWELTSVERVLLAGRALWFYASKLAWPHPLIFFYPRWTVDDSQWWQYLYPLAALGLLVALWALRRRIGRGALAGTLIFAGVLVPALGFFNVYPFRFSFVADHFQYHASIGLIAIAAAAVALGSLRLNQAWTMPLAAVLILVPLTITARQRTPVYRGLESLYEDTIAQNPACWIAHHNLGAYLKNAGRYREAIEHYRQAVQLDPKQHRLRISLAVVLLMTNELDEAAVQLNEALTDNPNAADQSDAWLYLGNVRAAQKRFPEAFEAYAKSLAAQPDNHLARYFQAVALGASGQPEAAIDMLRDLLQLTPNFPEGHHKMGQILVSMGRFRDAIPPLERAVQLAPGRERQRFDLANALFQAERFDQAEQQVRAVLQLNGQYAEAHNMLGALLGRRNDFSAAIDHFSSAVRINPNYAEARDNLNRAIQAQQRLPSR